MKKLTTVLLTIATLTTMSLASESNDDFDPSLVVTYPSSSYEWLEESEVTVEDVEIEIDPIDEEEWIINEDGIAVPLEKNLDEDVKLDKTVSSDNNITYLANTNYPLHFYAMDNDVSAMKYTTLTKVSYSNKHKYVSYYYRDYILNNNMDGTLDYMVNRYKVTHNKNGTIAERKNNPGNITCASGLRSKAYDILVRNVKDKGDARSCIYASEYIGFRDYRSLLNHSSYNDKPIKKAFKKYQSSMKSFRQKLKALQRRGVNINKKYNRLTKVKRDIFAKVYARYEGWGGIDSSNSSRTTLGSDYGTLSNDISELNSYLISDEYNQVITKIELSY